MDRSNVIYLISETYSQNEYGILEKSTDKKKVYCQVNSVSASEFFEGGRSGLNPDYRITMFRYDYDGEKLLEYDGEEYSIYRTYITRNDEIELYVERKGGNTAEPETPSTESVPSTESIPSTESDG